MGWVRSSVVALAAASATALGRYRPLILIAAACGLAGAIAYGYMASEPIDLLPVPDGELEFILIRGAREPSCAALAGVWLAIGIGGARGQAHRAASKGELVP